MESVIITSPNLDSNVNIGGISALTNLTAKYNKSKIYIHFFTGRKDGENKSLIWIFKQFILPINFVLMLIKNKNVKFCHINIPQDNKGICRECFLAFLSKLFNKKLIVHLRGGEYNMKIINIILIRYIFKITLNIADNVICLGNNEKYFLLKTYKLKTKKLNVLENAVEIKTKIISKDYSGIITLIFIGRIDKNKGFDEIINALNYLNTSIDFRFILCGKGPYEDYVIKEFSSILGSKFEFHGVVTGLKKERLFNESHIFLLPSYFEGLPNALLESMSFGVVPICTNVGSIPNVITNKQNGYLIPVKESNLLYETIVILANDRTNLKNLSISAHKSIIENYSINKYVSNLNKIYNSI